MKFHKYRTQTIPVQVVEKIERSFQDIVSSLSGFYNHQKMSPMRPVQCITRFSGRSFDSQGGLKKYERLKAEGA